MLSLTRLEPDLPVTGFGLEAIDFQPPGFYKLLCNIFQSIIDQTATTADGLITQKMIDGTSLVKLVRAQRGMFLKEMIVVDTKLRPELSFNMYTNMADPGSGHILNHQIFENWKAYTGRNFDKAVLGKLYTQSKGVLKGGVDLKTAQLTGDFTRIPFEVGISDDFILKAKQQSQKSNKTLKGEHIVFTFLHELGHVWDTFEYMVYGVRTNLVINAAICCLVAEPDESKRRQILVDLENEINTPLPDKNELAKKNDGPLYYVSLQGRAQQQRISIYQAYGYDDINNENGADIFATRFGAGRAGIEVISMFGDEYAAFQKQRSAERLARNLAGAGFALTATALWFGSAGLGLLLGAAVGGMMGSVIAVVNLISTSSLNDNYVGKMYDDYHGRAERALREMYAQLKNPGLTRDERQLLQLDIDNGKKALANIGKDNALAKSFVQLFNAAARNELNIKQMQVTLESLVNNSLYSQANRFELLREDT